MCVGEYFGGDATTSYGRMFLCFLLHSQAKTKHASGKIIVVTNPTDSSYSYCLPLLNICYAGGASSPLTQLIHVPKPMHADFSYQPAHTFPRPRHYSLS